LVIGATPTYSKFRHFLLLLLLCLSSRLSSVSFCYRVENSDLVSSFCDFDAIREMRAEGEPRSCKLLSEGMAYGWAQWLLASGIHRYIGNIWVYGH
jgi:hypothetical protein